MLLMSSVLLFIQGNEVGYNLYVNDEGKYFFKPTTYTNRNFFPPTFWVYKLGAQWEFDGVNTQEIKDQAIEEIRYHLNFDISSQEK